MLDPHEFELLTKIAQEQSSLHQKVDGLYNQRFEDNLRQKEVCDKAASSRKELHEAVEEYHSDKKLVLNILKYTGAVGFPVLSAALVWIKKHGLHFTP